MIFSRTLILAGSVTGLLFVTPAFAQFSDVPPSRTDAKAIAHVFSRGIVKGYPDGTFRPDARINRAEFAKIAVLFYWGDQPKYIDMCNSTHFDDVASDQWFFRYVCSAKDHGIIEGYPGTREFRPQNQIATAEALKMITLAFRLETTGAEGDWYMPYVIALGNRRALPLSLVSLETAITRGQLAEIVYRLDENILSADSYTSEQLTGVKNEGNPCTDPPAATVMGDVRNPVSPKYEGLHWLGQLFTADDCGAKRLTSLYDDLSTKWTQGSGITLKKAPSLELYNLLYGIGYAPTEGNDAAKSTRWENRGSITIRQLLQLKPYAAEMKSDDCIFCG